MPIRRIQLWKVPAFCIAAGIISFYLTVYTIAIFGVAPLSSGQLTTNEPLSTAVMVFTFLVSIVLGWLLLRTMTKQEIFWSATILVAAQLIMQTVQLATSGVDLSLSNRIGICLTYATEWCRLISMVLHTIIDDPWICAFLICFAPYVFILFGRKENAA